MKSKSTAVSILSLVVAICLGVCGCQQDDNAAWNNVATDRDTAEASHNTDVADSGSPSGSNAEAPQPSPADASRPLGVDLNSDEDASDSVSPQSTKPMRDASPAVALDAADDTTETPGITTGNAPSSASDATASADTTESLPDGPTPEPVLSSGNVVSVSGQDMTLNGDVFLPVGLRVANALITQEATDELAANLDLLKTYGVNTVSVFVMGSRFGDFKAYDEAGQLVDPFRSRLLEILEATDSRQMVVLVGCLYWGGSTAKYEQWSQQDAEVAVANTARLLIDSGYRNVLLDVNNEGMASQFSDNDLILAAKAVDASLVVGTSGASSVPDSSVMLHFGARVAGKPYIESEGSSTDYWGSWSRQGDDANYRNVGVYEQSMRDEITSNLSSSILRGEGYLLGSTWLQAVPPLGPNHRPGGSGTVEDPGILWFLEHLHSVVGPYVGASKPTEPPLPDEMPPQPSDGTSANKVFVESDGELSIEAENFAAIWPSTYSAYAETHEWFTAVDREGYSGDGFMVVLPDERGEGDEEGVSSPRDNSGAGMTYPVRIDNPGTYYVFVRGMSLGGESNGIHIGVDGALDGDGLSASNMSGFRPHNEWIWESGRKDGYDAPARITLNAGEHTLNVWNRDDAFRLDKIVLRQVNEAPTGNGPDESLLAD